MTIVKGFRTLEEESGLDKKRVLYSAPHTYGTLRDGEERQWLRSKRSMGHAESEVDEAVSAPGIEPLRKAINQRIEEKVWSGFGK